MTPKTVASIRGLTVRVPSLDRTIVADFELELRAGEIVGVVGESGSGKTTAAMALLGYTRPGARISAGDVTVAGIDMLALTPAQLRRLYGALVAYMPQDPSAALNPSLRIGEQLGEVFDVHRTAYGADEQRKRIAAGLREVNLPADEAFLKRFPHQLSGGQQQRVYLAMMFLLSPRVVVLDEPTTGLDVTTQRSVLEIVKRLCRQHDSAAVYVSHDLAAVRSLVDRVLIMHDGRIVEEGEAASVFDYPAHSYTRSLLAAAPDINRPGPERSVTTPAEEVPLLRVENLDAFHGSHQVLHGISLTITAGECVSLVGESGSGKTTFSRALIGLHANRTGLISLDAEPLMSRVRKRTSAQRRRVQYIFQSPYNSLNPRRTIGDSIQAALTRFERGNRHTVRARVHAALERVSMPAHSADRYPGELSGGERQRASIARALVTDPDVLLCDEITSALDVSVQASIIELIDDLRRRDGLAVLFVTHNLALVRSMGGRMLVFNEGRVVEQGDVEAVISSPAATYTRRLLENTPSLGHLTERETP